MTEELLTRMFSVVENLSQKSQLNESEFMAYLRGLEFVEKYYELNSKIVERELEDENDRDEKQCV